MGRSDKCNRYPLKSGKIVKALVYRGGSSVRSRKTRTLNCRFCHADGGITYSTALDAVLSLSLFSPPLPFLTLFSYFARTILVRAKKIFLYFLQRKKRLGKQRLYFLEATVRQDAFRPALTPFDVSRTLISNLLTNGFTLTLFQNDRRLDWKCCLFDCYSPITFISISFFFCLCNLLIIATLHFGQVLRKTAFLSLYPVTLYPQFGQYSCVGVTLYTSIYALILPYIGTRSLSDLTVSWSILFPWFSVSIFTCVWQWLHRNQPSVSSKYRFFSKCPHFGQ